MLDIGFTYVQRPRIKEFARSSYWLAFWEIHSSVEKYNSDIVKAASERKAIY